MNKTLLLLLFSLPLASCRASPVDLPATPAVRLEATVSALGTRVAGLQTALERTATPVSTVIPPPEAMPASEPTTVPPSQPRVQVTPYVGPVKIGALAFAPAGDALYLASTIDLQRNQDGIEQTLYTWLEAIPDLLADFSADGSVLAARMNHGDIAILALPEGELLRTLKIGLDFEEWPVSLALSSGGSQLALALGENTVHVWEVKTGALLATLIQPGEGITYQTISFSPDGTTLLGGFLNTITQWDIRSGEVTTFEPGCRGDAIFDLAYSPDVKDLAILCGPVDYPVGNLILWDVINTRQVFRLEELSQMQRVAFSNTNLGNCAPRDRSLQRTLIASPSTDHFSPITDDFFPQPSILPLFQPRI